MRMIPWLAVKLADSGYIVSYEEQQGASTWRREGTVTNVRDMSSLTLPDFEHGCGGA